MRGHFDAKSHSVVAREHEGFAGLGGREEAVLGFGQAEQAGQGLQVSAFLAGEDAD